MRLEKAGHQPCTEADRVDVPGGELYRSHRPPYLNSIPFSWGSLRRPASFRTAFGNSIRVIASSPELPILQLHKVCCVAMENAMELRTIHPIESKELTPLSA